MKKLVNKIKCFFGYHKTNEDNWVSVPADQCCLYNGMGDHQHQNCQICGKQQYRLIVNLHKNETTN